MKKISTSQLSKQLGVNSKELFDAMNTQGYIDRHNDSWVLTDKGRGLGGEIKESKKFGDYITWPDDLPSPIATESPTSNTNPTKSVNRLSATALGTHFKIPARRANMILSELGWIKKHLKGWQITELGIRIGGDQRENVKTGIPYVMWPEGILDNENLKKTIGEVTGVGIVIVPDEEPSTSNTSSFRSSVPKQRTADGHYVRSRAEMLIDNWLYMAEIVHAYERRLPVEEEVYCDFYLPVGKVYIEFWGMESNPKYMDRKKAKKEIYQKYGLNLVELNDDDIINLDDVLPKLLLKHGITTY